MARFAVRLPVAQLGVVAALWLLLEISARAYCFGWDAFDYAKLDSFHSISRSGLLQPAVDPRLQVELRPNLHTYFKLVSFSTNSHGFRDMERALAKDRGSFRIAMVGGSYVMGSGVEFEETVERVLERRLAQDRIRAEVLNLAVGGYAPSQALALLETRALGYHPDLILFGVTPAQYAQDSGPAPPAPEIEHAFFNCYLLRLLEVRVGALWRKWRPGALPATDVTAARHRIDAIFSRLAAVQRARGVAVHVLLLEHLNSHRELLPELQAAAGAHGLAFIDASASFAAAGFPEHCANVLDCHPDATTQRIVAAVIHDFLVSHRSLPGASHVSP